MNKEEVKTVLEGHATWLRSGGSKGERADLVGANLSGADLSGADLEGASLTGANLKGANLMGTNMYGVNYKVADLSGAILDKKECQQSTTPKEPTMSNPQLDSLRTDVEIQKLSLEIEMIKGQIGQMGQIRTLQVEALKAVIELIPDVKNVAKAILQKVEKSLATKN